MQAYSALPSEIVEVEFAGFAVFIEGLGRIRAVCSALCIWLWLQLALGFLFGFLRLPFPASALSFTLFKGLVNRHESLPGSC